MLHLLQLEWLKMRHYRPFKVLIILYIVSLLPLLMIISTMDLPEEAGLDSIFMFPDIWLWLGYAGNWSTFFFLGFLAILMTTNEFSYRTARQNIMCGITRTEWLTSKLLFILSVSIFATLVYVILGFLFGFINTDYVVTQRITEQMYYIPRYCLMCFGYMSFAFMLSIWIRRSGLAILAYLTYIFVIEMILRYGLHPRLFGSRDGNRYYPLNAIEDLVHFFDYKRLQLAADSVQSKDFVKVLSGWEAVLFSSVYIGIFIFVSFWLMKRRDL